MERKKEIGCSRKGNETEMKVDVRGSFLTTTESFFPFIVSSMRTTVEREKIEKKIEREGERKKIRKRERETHFDRDLVRWE